MTKKDKPKAAATPHESPADHLKAELEALGCTVEIVRTSAVTVAYDGGDIGGTFTVHVVGNVGSDEAAKIVAKAKAELPLGKKLQGFSIKGGA